MANENKKDFNAMPHNSKDVPKMKIITDTENIKRHGGSRMYFAPPIDYDMFMRRIPFDRVTTVRELCDYFARVSHADFTELITVGIFVSIATQVSAQRRDDPTPHWGTLKASGKLNAKYPGSVSAQEEKLEAGGHTVICRGGENIRYFTKDYRNALFDLTQGKQASWYLQEGYTLTTAGVDKRMVFTGSG